MAHTTTLKCDRCKQSWNLPDHRQLWRIGVSYYTNAPAYYSSDFKQPNQGHIAEWCRGCMVEMGLLGPSSDGEDKDKIRPDPPPTLEDLVRAICREEIEA